MLHQIKAQQFYTNFPVLMSPLSQSNISEVEFQHLDQYYSLALSPWKLSEMLLEVLEMSLNFTHTCLYEPWYVFISGNRNDS